MRKNKYEILESDSQFHPRQTVYVYISEKNCCSRQEN